MFSLYKNTYGGNGVCLYRDFRGDEAFFKRTENGFVTKLRLADKVFKMEPLYVDIPIKEGTEGTELKINCLSPFSVDDIADIINGYSVLINRWIAMCYDLETLQKVKQCNQPITGYLEELKKYEELCTVLETFD